MSVDKIERCEPPAEHLGKRWHWLRTPSGEIEPALVNEHGVWEILHDQPMGAVSAYADGWRYVGPCEEPAPISKLDLAWEAVNALGGQPQQPGNQHEAGYIEGISAALDAIEKLGGKDPAPARARDWFAGQALASEQITRAYHCAPAELAKYGYQIADAMLAERAKGVKP